MGANNHLADQIKISFVEGAATAGTSTLTTDIVDMQGYDGCVFVAILGDVTSGSVLSFKAQQNTANSTSGMADLAGSTIGATAGASDYDSKMLVIDVHQPKERYLQAVLARGSQNAVVVGIIAIQYRARALPVASTWAALMAKVVAPAEA